MSLKPDQITQLAYLSALSFSPEEKLNLIEEIDTILLLIDQIQSIPNKDIEPLSNPFDEVQTLRPDAVTEFDQRKRLQAGTQFVEDGLYLVPRVVD